MDRRSHVKRVSQRELRGARSTIGDRESGIRESSDSRQREYRFPDGIIPDKKQGSRGWNSHRVSGIYKTRSVSSGLAITRGPISR
jgi:hypothetical protein